MTGIVVVSHSRALARAAVDLAAEMVHGDEVRIAVAAGLDETTLGTDATAIMSAMEEVDDGSGVVVLMDLGSAVLSAELALDLIDPELRERTVLSPAPLVEGLAVAVVAAAGGAGPAEVAAEAAGALAAKQAQLGGPAPAAHTAPEPDAGPAPADFVASEFELANPHGLHARPAAALVRAARSADAVVELRNVSTDSGWVPAGSLSRVATLGALRGHRLEVRASGPGAEAAVADVLALAARRFDEPDQLATDAVPGGTAAGSAGLAIDGPGPGTSGRRPGPSRPGPSRSRQRRSERRRPGNTRPASTGTTPAPSEPVTSGTATAGPPPTSTPSAPTTTGPFPRHPAWPSARLSSPHRSGSTWTATSPGIRRRPGSGPAPRCRPCRRASRAAAS